MLFAVVDVLGPVLVIVICGNLYARFRPAQMDFINKANMDVFVPALIFSALTGHDWSVQMFSSLLMVAALIILLPGLLTLPLLPFTGLKGRVLLPPVMFNNSGNLGLPLMVFAFGESALPAAVMLFIVENTLHFTVGMAIVSQGKDCLSFLKSPMIWATLAAFVVHTLQLPIPLFLDRAIDLTGQVAIPLMLFALGVRIGQARLTGISLTFIAGLWIPITGLASAFISFWLLESLELAAIDQGQQNMLWLYAVLPPAVLNFLVAERYLTEDKQKHQVAELVLWGNLLCVVPIGIVLALLL